MGHCISTGLIVLCCSVTLNEMDREEEVVCGERTLMQVEQEGATNIHLPIFLNLTFEEVSVHSKITDSIEN